jgi:hypothetical protein
MSGFQSQQSGWTDLRSRRSWKEVCEGGRSAGHLTALKEETHGKNNFETIRRWILDSHFRGGSFHRLDAEGTDFLIQKRI